MKIPAMKVFFDDEDQASILREVASCLRNGQIAQGANVVQFETLFATILGVKHAIAVSSGGAALEIAARILGVKGKTVLAPTNTFFGSISGIVLAGGNVKLVDIDEKTLSPSLESLEAAYTKDVVGMVLVHIGGIITPDIERIKTWCESNNLWLIEDAAHAHGSSLNDRYAGSFGDISAFSFFSTKVVACGEGGMIVTENDDYASLARRLRDYGKESQWITLNCEAGANWRMSEFCAIVGVTQLKRMIQNVELRSLVAARYDVFLEGIAELACVSPSSKSSWYKYIVLLSETIDRTLLKNTLKQKGISLAGGVYEIPLHRQPVLKGDMGNYPVSDSFSARHICLPIFPQMNEAEQRYVVENLRIAINDQHKDR